MDDELNALTDRHSDFEHPAAVIGADQYVEPIELDDSNRVAVGVGHVGVGDPVLSSARQNHRIRRIKLP